MQQRTDLPSRSGKLSLDGLNEPQRCAVMHRDGPLLVLAGAGSGKTRVIIYRIARLIDVGVPADAILGVTFTNKAAAQMRQRLTALVGRAASRVTLSTFHALGLTILKEEYAAAGLRPQFCIYDTADQLSLIRDIMRQIKVADRRLDAGRILDLILATKRARRSEVELLWGDDYELAAFDLYPRYLSQMKAFNAIDFDDLILRSQDVLSDAHVRQRWSARFTYVLVDEYQDTSPDQLALVRALAGTAQNVCAVGDDDQSIYGWRGAAADNILSFSRHFNHAQEVVLEQNYRSTGNILHIANGVIKHNLKRKQKVLFTSGGAGAPVQRVECVDDTDEANFVSETIRTLTADGVSYRDIAVLYRSNVQSRIFEETLALERQPYRVVGGQAFFDRKEVRDAMSFLAAAQNPADEVALRRIVNVPPRGIGSVSLERLTAHGEQQGMGLWGALQKASEVSGLPPAAQAGAAELVAFLRTADVLRHAPRGEAAGVAANLFERLKLKDAILAADDAPSMCTRRLENLEQVVSALARFEQRSEGKGPILADFLHASALVREPDEGPPEDEITLMTLHSAKGLEFKVVFFVGMEEELLPHRKSIEDSASAGPQALSEERRLCYVGMTRARERLYLCWARHRIVRGKPVPRQMSRFISDLPDDAALRSINRSTHESDPVSDDQAAQAFFKKMRAQFGIEGAS